MKLINIGFNNMVSAERIVALVTPDSAPAKRLIQEARDAGNALDCTCGRRTRCVIVTDSDHVILSAIQSETIAGRLEGDGERDDREPEDKADKEEKEEKDF